MSTEQGNPADEPTGTGTGANADTGTGGGDGGATAAGQSESGADDADGDPGASPREYLRGWFTGRLPAGWFTTAPAIDADREEITIVGTLPDPETEAGASEAERAAAAEGRMRRFREETRARRVEIARKAEHRFRRMVSWSVTCGG